MSSYLSKSKKDIRPKAPTRRLGAGGGVGGVTSSQSSIRGSAERQTHPTQTQLTAASNTTAGPIQNQRISASPGPQTLHDRAKESGSSLNRSEPGQRLSPSPQRSQERHVDFSRSQLLPTTRSPPPPPPSSPPAPPPPAVPVSTSTSASAPTAVVGTTAPSIRDTTSTNQNDAATAHLAPPDQENQAASIERLGRKQRPRKKAKKDQQRRKRLTRETLPDAGSEDNQDEIAVKGPSRKKRRKGRRALTPENAETLEISQNVITMSELTKDIRQGKMSTREARLRERDAEERARRQERAQEQAEQETEQSLHTDNASATNVGSATTARDTTTANGTQTPSAAVNTSTPAQSAPRIAPQVRLVNGQIVQDEESRMIDRHGAAAAMRASEDDVRVEDELTRKINSGAYMKRESHTKWDEGSTELFYDGLRMFGTDFMTISKLFPGRSRRQIKLKFNKEERTERDKVRRALLFERKPAILHEIEALAGEAYPDPALLEETMMQDRLRLEEEQRREVGAMEELVRQRERDAAAESGAVGVT